MTITLSGIYSGLFTLSGAADDPATITATGVLDAGLYAPSLITPWSITNAGSVLGTGITLQSTGSVLNLGDIAGASASGSGVFLLAGGGIVNLGRISGLDGIQSQVGAASVLNEGSITGNAIGKLGRGLRLGFGGGVTNEISGVIAGYDAIEALLGAATVVNAGGIVGNATTSGGKGIVLDSGGNITNQGFGVIIGYDGIESGLIGGVTVENSGSIAGNATASGGKGLVLDAGGLVSNRSFGVISGYNGIYGAADGAITVVNAGRIAANMTAGGGSGVKFMTGNVTNANGGTISGHFGVYSGHAGTTIVNDGLITGNATKTGRGVSVYDGGYVANQQLGSIVGNYGIFAGTVGAVTVVNAGRIADVTSKVGIYLHDGTVINTGSISGFQGLYSNDKGAVTVANAGTIAGSRGNAIRLGNGSVNNQQSGSIYGMNGLYGAGSVDVVNAGRIAGNPTVAGAVGIFVEAGSVTNQMSGTITGYGGILSGFLSDPTVVNEGRIEAGTVGVHGAGVYLQYDGSITNNEFGTISGRFGVSDSGPNGTIVNSGSILGTATAAGASGVSLKAHGTVTNQLHATISGYYGLFGGATVVNDGLIAGNTTAPNASGVRFTTDGLSLTNQIHGTISGYYGVLAGSPTGVTVTNAGTISGTRDAVIFRSGTASRLIVEPHAVFVGTVTALNLAAAATLELASAAPAGTLSQLGTQFVGFSQVVVDAGGFWTLTGPNTLPIGATLTNAGSLTLLDASLTADAVVNNGGIVLDPSTMTVASLTGTGTVTIASGGTLDVQGTVASGETIVFAGAGAYLHIRAPDSFSGSIVSFAAGETIDLAGVAPPTVAYAAGRLSFGTGGGSIALATSPELPLTAFASADGSEVGTLCFCANTRILTDHGECAVQDLATGDRVVTQGGGALPIVWIGVGKVLATRGRRSAATPVIVRKGALGPNVPHIDLRVTKGHGLLFDGALIPVEFLVNHRSILWDDLAQEVSLYHVELARHDVLLANGAAAESYREDGNRWLFANANSGWGQSPKPLCAPVLTGGPAVDAVWRRLLDRAGARPSLPWTEDPDLHLEVAGTRVEATARTKDTWVFEVPARSAVRIVSRAAVPQELGIARDARCLGVALRCVSVRKGSRFRMVSADDGMLADGFHAFEPAMGLRWTDGNAVLPEAMFAGFAGTVEVVIGIGGTTRYVEDEGSRRAA